MCKSSSINIALFYLLKPFLHPNDLLILCWNKIILTKVFKKQIQYWLLQRV